jgi:cobalt/nickel transport system permease protein
VYRLVLGRSPANARRVAATAFGSWVATVVAAATCAGELVLSGVAAPGVVLPAMVGVHAVIGLGEAVIAALVVATVLRLRPELMAGAQAKAAKARLGSVAVLGLAPSLGLAFFLSPFASKWPDGLERVAERLGVQPSHARLVEAPLRDYAIPGLGSPFLTTALAGALGTLLVFALSWALGSWLTSPARSS